MQLKKEYVNLLLGQIKLASSRPYIMWTYAAIIATTT